MFSSKKVLSQECGPLLRDIARLETGVLPVGFNSKEEEQFGQINTAAKIVNDETKFIVKIDVSQFRPEELDVRINGHILRIRGSHEWKDHYNFVKRSFVRKWNIPEDVDMSAIRSHLSPSGSLSVQAPKLSLQRNSVKNN